MSKIINASTLHNNGNAEVQVGLNNDNFKIKRNADNTIGFVDSEGKDIKLNNIPTADEMNKAIENIPTPDVSGQITDHNTSSDAHVDIRRAIENIPTPDVSGQINEHNNASDAHNDIRELITGLQNQVSSLTASAVAVFSGFESDVTPDVGIDGDVFLVTR